MLARTGAPACVLLLLIACLLAAAGGCGDSSEAKSAPSGQTQKPSVEKAAPLSATVELGEIVLSQLRPLENSTLHVRFEPQAVASEENARRLARELTRHRHEAREKVIVAVRAAETWEFDEPDLQKLRRRIVLALNRWLDAPLVEDVALTEFRCRVD
jgi:flagellar basal body-associated protein FliL